MIRWLLVLIVVSLAPSPAAPEPGPGTPQLVRVGGYVFPPYVEKQGSSYGGITRELLEAMNRFQDEYRFEFVPTSSIRRYDDMELGLFSMIFFESRAWGWTDRPVEETRELLHDGEVYVARREPGRTQQYFDDFSGKRIVAILGYHYGFAGFDADRERLRREHHTTVTNTHAGNLRAVIDGRAEIAVVTISYLQRYLRDHAAEAELLLVSTRLDQVYHHPILVRSGTQPDAAKIDELLARMEKAGVLGELWTRLGVTPR